MYSQSVNDLFKLYPKSLHKTDIIVKKNNALCPIISLLSNVILRFYIKTCVPIICMSVYNIQDTPLDAIKF